MPELQIGVCVVAPLGDTVQFVRPGEVQAEAAGQRQLIFESELILEGTIGLQAVRCSAGY